MFCWWIRLLWTCHRKGVTPCGRCGVSLSTCGQSPSMCGMWQGIPAPRGCMVLCMWTDMSVSAHQLMDTWALSAFWPP